MELSDEFLWLGYVWHVCRWVLSHSLLMVCVVVSKTAEAAGQGFR